MKEEGKWVDPLKRLIEEHEEVSEYLEALKEVLGFLDNEEAWNKIKPIENFFKQNVVDHFKFEEEIVFPPILSRAATPESIKLILELQREHGGILKELEEFQNIVSKSTGPLDKETSDRLNVVGRVIIDSLLLHASKEDDKLLPILEKNRQIFDKHREE